jgi:hypothetical protein
VTARRTKRDNAEVVRDLIEERYPDTECICVVQDNLNPRTAGALYETFPPQRARRIMASPGFPLHAQTRQLAQSNGDRDQQLRTGLPFALRGWRTHVGAAGADAGSRAQRPASHHRLALHHRPGPAKLTKRNPGVASHPVQHEEVGSFDVAVRSGVYGMSTCRPLTLMDPSALDNPAWLDYKYHYSAYLNI